MVFSMFLIKIQKCYCMMGITFNVNKKNTCFQKPKAHLHVPIDICLPVSMEILLLAYRQKNHI